MEDLLLSAEVIVAMMMTKQVKKIKKTFILEIVLLIKENVDRLGN